MGGRAARASLPPHLASLCFSAVNFDHFQILRAIGKGSFGKVSGVGQGHGRMRCWAAAPSSHLGLSVRVWVRLGHQSQLSVELTGAGSHSPGHCRLWELSRELSAQMAQPLGRDPDTPSLLRLKGAFRAARCPHFPYFLSPDRTS